MDDGVGRIPARKEARIDSTRSSSEGPPVLSSRDSERNLHSASGRFSRVEAKPSRVCRLKSFTDRLRQAGFLRNKDAHKSATSITSLPVISSSDREFGSDSCDKNDNFSIKTQQKSTSKLTRTLSSNEGTRYSPPLQSEPPSYTNKGTKPISRRPFSMHELMASKNKNADISKNDSNCSSSRHNTTEDHKTPVCKTLQSHSAPLRSASFSRIQSFSSKMNLNKFFGGARNSSVKASKHADRSATDSSSYIGTKSDVSGFSCGVAGKISHPDVAECDGRVKCSDAEDTDPSSLNNQDKNYYSYLEIQPSFFNISLDSSNGQTSKPEDSPAEFSNHSQIIYPNNEHKESRKFAMDSSFSNDKLSMDGLKECSRNQSVFRQQCRTIMRKSPSRFSQSSQTELDDSFAIKGQSNDIFSASSGSLSLPSRENNEAHSLPTNSVVCQNNKSALTIEAMCSLPESPDEISNDCQTMMKRKHLRSNGGLGNTHSLGGQMGDPSPAITRPSISFHLGPDVDDEEETSLYNNNLSSINFDLNEDVSPGDSYNKSLCSSSNETFSQYGISRTRSQGDIPANNPIYDGIFYRNQAFSDKNCDRNRNNYDFCRGKSAEPGNRVNCVLTRQSRIEEKSTHTEQISQFVELQDKNSDSFDSQLSDTGLKFAEIVMPDESEFGECIEDLTPIAPFYLNSDVVVQVLLPLEEVDTVLSIAHPVLFSADTEKITEIKIPENKKLSSASRKNFNIVSENTSTVEAMSAKPQCDNSGLHANLKLKSRSLSPIRATPKTKDYNKVIHKNDIKTITTHEDIWRKLKQRNETAPDCKDNLHSKQYKQERFQNTRSFFGPSNDSVSSSSSEDAKLHYNVLSHTSESPLRIEVLPIQEDDFHNCNVVDFSQDPTPPGKQTSSKTDTNFKYHPASLLRNVSPSSLSYDSESECTRISPRAGRHRLRGPYGEMLEEKMDRKQLRCEESQGFLATLSEMVTPPATSSTTDDSPMNTTRKKNQHCFPTPIDSEPSIVARPGHVKSLPPILIPERRINERHGRQNSAPVPGGQLSVTTGQSSGRKRARRWMIVEEMVETESTYVDSLQLMMSYYYRFQDASMSGLMDRSTLDIVFYMIPQLLEIHAAFLREISCRMENWSPSQTIADVIINKMSEPFVLRAYTSFVNNWQYARLVLSHQCQTKPNLAKALEKLERSHKKRLTLLHLLITPVQRIPQYELLLKQLLAHTSSEHAEAGLLPTALHVVHRLATSINSQEHGERRRQEVREIEAAVDGLEDLDSPDRQLVRQDLVTMTTSLGTRRQRALFLFSDVLILAAVKQRSTSAILKPSSMVYGTNSDLEVNKYKLLFRVAVQDCTVTSANDENKQVLTEIKQIEQDSILLRNISTLIDKLNCDHSQVEEIVQQMAIASDRQLSERNRSNSQLSQLQLTVTSQSVATNTLILQFSNVERCSQWYQAFHDCKSSAISSASATPSPRAIHVGSSIRGSNPSGASLHQRRVELIRAVAVQRTRTGLLLGCGAACIDQNDPTLSTLSVWACSSDGYVGQLCVLKLPTGSAEVKCHGVCNSRILCIACVPAAINSVDSPDIISSSSDSETNEATTPLMTVSKQLNLLKNENKRLHCPMKSLSSPSVSLLRDFRTPNKVPSSSHNTTTTRGGNICSSRAASIWLGTEDGCLYIFQCDGDLTSGRVKLQLTASVTAILHHDGCVLVGLANGTLGVYKRNSEGVWQLNSPLSVTVSEWGVDRMCVVNGSKLWLACRNTITVLQISTMKILHSGVLDCPTNSTVECMSAAVEDVWLSFHRQTEICLMDTRKYSIVLRLDVTPAVSSVLSECDDIIRQHKTACLRVTSLVTSAGHLWIGTSAGVIVTLSTEGITDHHHQQQQQRQNIIPRHLTGLTKGYTGQVRFLTCIQCTSRPSEAVTQKSRLTPDQCVEQGIENSELIISGGDGFEDYSATSAAQTTGSNDSTNHILVWKS